MSDELTIYISPDDDLTTVHERLKQVPARNVRLVIPNQTQLRSQTVWKVLYGYARKLSKDVIIVSSDPQVRSVAHAGKFRVAHSLESISSPGPSRSGSSPGTTRSSSGSSRGRSTVPSSAIKTHTTIGKEPASKRGASRPPRSTRAPLSGQTPARPELSSFVPPEPPESLSDEPRTAKPHGPGPSRLNLPERNERREERSGPQIYDFRPEDLPAIRPLSLDQIEESDLLPYTPIDHEDYETAQGIRQAATGSHPPVAQKPEDAEPTNALPDNVHTAMPGTEASPAPVDQSDRPGAEASPTPTNQFRRPISPVYGEDDPFVSMQDDSQLPSQSEQMGEAILQDDEISQEYPSFQKSAIPDLPTHVTESQIEYRGDNDDDIMLFPISSTSGAQAHPQAESDEEDETVEQRPSHRSPRPYDVPSRGDRSDILSPPGQPFSEEEDQLPGFSEHSTPMHVPQPLPLPMPRAQSKPLTPTAKPLTPRTGGQMQQPTSTQKPSASSVTRNGSRVSPAVRSRPALRPGQSRTGPTRAGSARNTSTRRPITSNRSRRPTRLYLVLVSIAAVLVILFAVLYLNTASTVNLAVTTQNYTSSLTFILSDKNRPNTVPAKLVTHSFTKTAPEVATGSTMQATNYAQGNVYFTNTSAASVQIPSQTVLTTANNVAFVTTANVLILPQGQSANPVPVPVKAVKQGIEGNVLPNTITVIPANSLSSIAQAQTSVVTPDSLKATLAVNNLDPITGGEAHPVAAVTQQDLDNAKKDLDTQIAQADLSAWQQTNTVIGLVGQPVITNDTLVNPPAVDTPAPDKAFSASVSVTATMLVAQLDAVQKVAVSQLNNAVQADQQLGPTFAVVGDWQTINIDLAQQKAGDGHTVTVPAKGKVGPNLNITDLQNSIKGKSLSDAQTLLRQKDQHIQKVNIQTQPPIFWWVSPWADHINVVTRSST